MKTQPPKPLEREIQANGIKALAAIGIKLYRRNVALHVAEHNGKTRVIRSGKKGQADVYGWDTKTGKHIEIEFKRPGERPNQAQLDWLWECGQTGAIAFWCDSTEIAMDVIHACLNGGKIHWLPNGDFDVR